jgi:hypothetical protein
VVSIESPMHERRYFTLFMFSHRTTRVINETLRVDEVDARAGFLLRQALQGEEAHELHANTHASGAGTKEENTVVGQRSARSGRGDLGGIEKPTENDGTSSLDIVIEDWVFIAVALKIQKGLVGREILHTLSDICKHTRETTNLKLDKQLGECKRHLMHKFVHESSHDFWLCKGIKNLSGQRGKGTHRNTFLAQTKV